MPRPMKTVHENRSALRRRVTNSIKDGLAARWIWSRVAREWTSRDLLVLTYHQVGPAEEGAPITADMFALQVDWLLDRCEIMAPEDLPDFLGGTVRVSHRPKVLLTFDDGHRCLVDPIYPILLERKLRAIAFLATGPVSDGSYVWTDDIRHRLLACEHGSVNLPILGEMFLGEDRQRLYLASRIIATLKTRPDAERRAVVEALQHQVPLTPPRSPMITWEEAAGMNDVFHWGAHTHSHPVLSRVSPSAARDEVCLSRNKIREMTGQVTNVFAYPNGTPDDYSETTKKILKNEEFIAAFTTISGYVSPGDDVFALKRCPTTAQRINDFAWMTARPSWLA